MLQRAPRASKEGVLVRQPAVDRVRDCAEVALLESCVGSVNKVVKRVPDAPSQQSRRQRREQIRNASAKESLVSLSALHSLHAVQQDPDVRGRGVALSIQADCSLDLSALATVLNAVHSA